MSCFRGQSVHMHWSPVSTLPSLNQWFKLAGMWLLVAELQVQINLSSPPHKGTIVFSQPGTQAGLKRAGKYWHNTHYFWACVCVVVYLWVYIMCVCELVTVASDLSVMPLLAAMRISSSSWQFLRLSLTGGVVTARYFLHETIMLHNVFKFSTLWLFIDSWLNSLQLTAPEGCSLIFCYCCCVIWYQSCHGNYLHLQSVNTRPTPTLCFGIIHWAVMKLPMMRSLIDSFIFYLSDFL